MTDHLFQSPTPKQKIYQDKITLYKLDYVYRATKDAYSSWYYRFSSPISVGYIRKSSNTSDYGQACKIAIEHYESLWSKKIMGLTQDGCDLKFLIKKFDSQMSDNPKTVKFRKKVYRRLLMFWKVTFKK